MKSRRIEASDLSEILEIYYKIEGKAQSLTLEGWTLSEIREQLFGFINSDNYISLCYKEDKRITAFVFCRVASQHLATIEILCKDPDCTPSKNKGWEIVFFDLINELKSRGIQTMNTLINKKHQLFAHNTRFFEFGGWSKTSEFVEYEMELG